MYVEGRVLFILDKIFAELNILFQKRKKYYDRSTAVLAFDFSLLQ